MLLLLLVKFSEYIADWMDPPYPRKDKMYGALKYRVHWKHDDDSFSLGDPQVNDFSEFEAEDEEEYDEGYYQEDLRES